MGMNGYTTALYFLWGFLIVAFPAAIVVGIIKSWRNK